MKIADAKMLFAAGGLRSATVREDTAQGGWTVEFDVIPTVQLPPYLEADRGGPRIFKSAATAIENVRAVGFDQTTVILEASQTESAGT